MKTLRLILGDQLNRDHSWFETPREDVLYLMAEMRQETDYVLHHIQKVVGFFASMRNFESELQSLGHEVRYFRISDPRNPQNLPDLIQRILEKEPIGRFEYQFPDEYRLDIQLRNFCNSLEIPWQAVDSEHFYTERDELTTFFKGKKQLLMESFYRMMRRKHGVLMEGSQPLGGKWNYDRQNRNAWKGTPAVPSVFTTGRDVSDLLEEIRKAGIRTLGSIDPKKFDWTTSAEEARALLSYFCEHLLPFFGAFQDAMHTGEKYLFHSRISFALNSKMISPAEVVDTVESYHRKNPEKVHISETEGFIRQILGWREYMRGVYWREMPGYSEKNYLKNLNPLPKFFWTAETGMNCLRHAISQSLETAYAHHIQRLMITGNFALLVQANPEEVDRWYLGIYADALEWVQLPNTRGMSQFADGGIVGTKPYISSANYIHKMSNYCKDCQYDPKERLGPKACPFNALYWNFLHAKRDVLADNPRMGMMYRLLDKKDPEELEALTQRAAQVIEHPEQF
ncbi:MAG: cryptochrome/photolyase family protein [Robiginitalea sp.]